MRESIFVEGFMMRLDSKIRVIPDFPKPGISFKDITPLLQDPEYFREAIDSLAQRLSSRRFEAIVCPEARGFIFGAALAYKLNVGFVPVRKAGKLPYNTIKGEYDLEYGKDTLEIHEDAVKPGQRVVVLDDVLATGGTIKAVADLVEKVGGVVDCMAFLIELQYIGGRQNLKQYEVLSLLEMSS